MADYFSEFSSFVGAAKGLPSPADTPYETPGYIRAKRLSRASSGQGPSRETSSSPPPLPPDTLERLQQSREGQHSSINPRRFTPTLHASLVSEILSLRRELESKNSLVENLETSLSATKNDNDTLSQRVSEHQKDIRKTKQLADQMERATYEAVQDLLEERNTARHTTDELRTKLEAATKKVRWQDEDALRAQGSWQQEKEGWENERRQLERRVHVTENRLRVFVDEVTAQQAEREAQDAQLEETGDESNFKDSGFGNESDTASIKSATPVVRHRRNMSSLSHRTRSLRNSVSTRASMGTPEPRPRANGYSLADELDIDEEDEYDLDEFEHPDDDLGSPLTKRRTITHSRHGSSTGELESKAKRVLGLTSESPDSPLLGAMSSPTKSDFPRHFVESPLKRSLRFTPVQITNAHAEPVLRAEYVDRGFQPSPPPSRQSKGTFTDPYLDPRMHEDEWQTATRGGTSPISPPDTPVVDGMRWPEDKDAASTKAWTKTKEPERPNSTHSNRDSLSPPDFVPSITIHPPTSTPASPRAYVLPPRTKNASAQANLSWSSRDACVQTENIRVDTRLRRLPSQLVRSLPRPLSSPSSSLPSPAFPDIPLRNRVSTGSTAKIMSRTIDMPVFPSPPLQSPAASSPEMSRDHGSKDIRSMPLRAITLPRPVLAPAQDQQEGASAVGPLNRSLQYGVTNPTRNGQVLDIDKDYDTSDSDELVSEVNVAELTTLVPESNRAPHGRFGLSQPPKAVPEDKEASPDRRPGTADSFGAAPAPSIASSRAISNRIHGRSPTKLTTHGKAPMSRSPSFTSLASVYSSQSVVPPFPIPTRSSSRVKPQTHSEGSQSPTPQTAGDIFGRGGHRSLRTHHVRQKSLRKVQSAAVIRPTARARNSPQKVRRGRKAPDLTPIHSMAFDTSPLPTGYPFPDLPTPMRESPGFDLVKGSVDLKNQRPSTSGTTARSQEGTDYVEAIAATMVGEWMWKYVRKRKSFGIGEDTLELCHDNINAHGTRHKRWVWLSPYERTIMWDTKQPSSGPALMGKKGRRLAIDSVIDVHDSTAIPKGSELSSAHDRSILVLTPQRALKFTTVAPGRHALWMTALTFLQSGGLPSQFPQESPQLTTKRAPPPLPPVLESVPIKRQRSPAFGGATIRDSVRLAQSRRPSLRPGVTQPDASFDSGTTDEQSASQDQGADFPSVPRLYSGTSRHQRKRSYTSPKLPAPLSNLRSFSSSAIPSSTSSRLQPGSINGSLLRTDIGTASSKGGNRPDSLASPVQSNFFDAVGIVRMEAFVETNMLKGVLYVPAPPQAPSLHGSRTRRGNSTLSASTVDKRRAGYVFDENGLDPFKGF